MSLPDRALRFLLLCLVIVLGAATFALALLPPLGAAGRAVKEFEQEFSAIGQDVDLTFPRIPERSTIYAADGSVLATLYLDENRKIVRLEKINQLTRNAVLAIEDEKFYEHPGLDYQGIVRALLANLRAGEIEQGASTITQQLARNVFTTIGTEQTLARKIQEAKVAMRLEDVYTKDQILELYLNEVYFGRGVYGIGTAAQYYFGKSAGSLTLPQAAMLAGLISAPETYSPVNDKAAALARRNVVLDRMAQLGMITPEEAAGAALTGLALDITEVGNAQAKFPFFVEYLKSQILNDPRFGQTHRARVKALFQGGLKIYTTLEPGLQRAGDNIVDSHLPSPADPESAIAAVDARTGAVTALVTGTDFDESQVNLATGQGGTGRQSGSAFKPFTLAAAFEQEIPVTKTYRADSGQVVNCSPWGPPAYRVVNAGDGGGSGYVNLATATAGSINAVFVQLAIDVGPPNIVDVAHRMGIESHLDPFCTITLGVEEVTPLEMASAFSTLANGGVHCEPFAITRVVGPTGKEILQQKHGRCRQVIEKEIADKVAGLLGLVVDQGTGTAAQLGQWDVFGKTGTTNDSADVWFSGCTRQVCAATWVGHPEARIPMPGAYGGTVAAPIWHDFMLRAMEDRPAQPLPAPPKPETAKVPDVVGLMEGEAVTALTEASFSLTVSHVPSATEAGIVVSQSPAGGSTVTAGVQVSISVSTGPEVIPMVTVPQVVGLLEADAAAQLEAAGLTPQASRTPTGDKNLKDTVADQSPEPGVQVEEGSSVAILVFKFQKGA